MKRALLGVVAGVVLSAAGCGIFAPHESVILPVTEIAAPASIPAGTRLSVELTVVTGGCTTFERIARDRSASGAMITVWGRHPVKGIGTGHINCPADIRYEKHTVRFDPPFASTFDVSVNPPGEGPVLTRRVRIE